MKHNIDVILCFRIVLFFARTTLMKPSLAEFATQSTICMATAVTVFVDMAGFALCGPAWKTVVALEKIDPTSFKASNTETRCLKHNSYYTTISSLTTDAF